MTVQIAELTKPFTAARGDTGCSGTFSTLRFARSVTGAGVSHDGSSGNKPKDSILV